MARFDELWRSVDGPGSPPRLDSRRVKARVNAALDAGQAERKIYMKQKLRTVLIAAAAVAALTGAAFAATTGWTGLSAWFKGDPAPVQEYVDNTVRSVSDENYTLTVEGMVADGSTAYLTVTITALSDEAKEFLWDDYFISMDTFYGGPIYDEAAEAKNSSASEAPASHTGPGSRELECREENARRFAVEMSGLPASTTAVRIRCGYMAKGKQIEVPFTPAPSQTVKIGARGKGVIAIGMTTLAEPETITINEITFSPLTLHIKGKGAYGTRPNIQMRMADGTIRTLAQMTTVLSGPVGPDDFHYQFKEVQDMDSIASFIVFDMEYPVDGSKPTPVEHDPALDPFTVTRMERLGEDSGYTLPVRELTEKLGGVYAWDPATSSVTCAYRGVTIVFHAGKDTALVNGETVDLQAAPAEQNGVLAADWLVFMNAWGLDGFVQREKIWNEKDPVNSTIIWGDWYIIP